MFPIMGTRSNSYYQRLGMSHGSHTGSTRNAEYMTRPHGYVSPLGTQRHHSSTCIQSVLIHISLTRPPPTHSSQFLPRRRRYLCHWATWPADSPKTAHERCIAYRLGGYARLVASDNGERERDESKERGFGSSRELTRRGRGARGEAGRGGVVVVVAARCLTPSARRRGATELHSLLHESLKSLAHLRVALHCTVPAAHPPRLSSRIFPIVAPYGGPALIVHRKDSEGQALLGCGEIAG